MTNAFGSVYMRTDIKFTPRVPPFNNHLIRFMLTDEIIEDDEHTIVREHTHSSNIHRIKNALKCTQFINIISHDIECD